jgi:hypothetical protein
MEQASPLISYLLMGRSTVIPWPESQEILRRTGSEAISPQKLPMRQHLAPTRYWFDQAQRRGREPMQTSYFRFADAPVRMRVAGHALNDHLRRSYAQLLADDVNPDGPFALTIDAWDRATIRRTCSISG